MNSNSRITEEEMRAADRLKTKIERLRRRPEYVDLVAKIKKAEKNLEEFLDEFTPDGEYDPNLPDDHMVLEVDYIIASTQRNVGDEELTEKVLVKFTSYPVPCWEKAEKVPMFDQLVYLLRQARLDCVEYFIREIEGDKFFEKHYPCRYLNAEKGAGNGGYIKNEIGLYKNRLRAHEHHYNNINKKKGIQPVYVEDWTNFVDGDVALTHFDYIQQIIKNDVVKEILAKNMNGLSHIKCVEKCAYNCNGVRKKGSKECCSQNKYIASDANNIPQFVDTRQKDGFPVRFECTDECKCDPSTCQNRVVQKGRQHVVLCIRHPVKQWTLRCLSEMSAEDLIGAYCGEIQDKHCEDPNAIIYDYNLMDKVQINDNEEGPLWVSAYDKGNETRMISHACKPNCRAESVIIERNGLFYKTMAFFPDRRLTLGEELTFDYFDHAGPEDEKCEYKNYFDICGCGSPACRFTKKKIAAADALIRTRAAQRLSSEDESSEDEEGDKENDNGNNNK